jgi:hypothetical protein
MLPHPFHCFADHSIKTSLGLCFISLQNTCHVPVKQAKCHNLDTWPKKWNNYYDIRILSGNNLGNSLESFSLAYTGTQKTREGLQDSACTPPRVISRHYFLLSMFIIIQQSLS